MDAVPPPIQPILHCVEAAPVANIEARQTLFVAGTEDQFAQLQGFLAQYPSWSVKVLSRESAKVVASVSTSQTIPWREVAAIIYKAQLIGMDISFFCASDTGESK